MHKKKPKFNGNPPPIQNPTIFMGTALGYNTYQMLSSGRSNGMPLKLIVV